MRQKVGIAIALAKNASIYLDEPASGLDPVASNELSYILKRLSSMELQYLWHLTIFLELEKHAIK